MDKPSESSPTHASNEAIQAIEARLSALEQQISAQSGRFEERGGNAEGVGHAELSAELERHRDQLRDYEKALVERIADVDDDRRATASKLQRAWQTQREEIDERLRRFAGLVLGLMALFAVLVVVVLVLVYWQATTGQPDVAAQVAEIRQELTQQSGKGAVSTQLSEKLERLTGQVGEIASSVDRLDQQGPQSQGASRPVAAERAAREENLAAVEGEIRRLDAEQKRLAQALTSLQSVVDDVKASRAKQPADKDAAIETKDEASGNSGSPPATDTADAPRAGSVEPKLEAVLDDSVEAKAKESPATVETVHVKPQGAGVGADTTNEGGDSTASDSERTLVAGGDIYALQLIGYFSEESVDEFVARKGLPTQVYVDQQTYQGRPWYVVIHSLHDDYAAAEEALSQLPAALSKLHPMIRSLSDVTELKIIKTGHRPE